jgi:hypothetical protein
MEVINIHVPRLEEGESLLKLQQKLEAEGKKVNFTLSLEEHKNALMGIYVLLPSKNSRNKLGR